MKLEDLRIIKIGEDGYIDFGDNLFHPPLTQFESAIQDVVIAIFNTAGTMIDAVEFGGSANKLYLKPRNDLSIASVISSASESLSAYQDPARDYSVSGLQLIEIKAITQRDVEIVVNIIFNNLMSTTITIPGAKDVTI